jgi:hypothetical protein
MKEVNLNKNDFWSDGRVVSSLGMGSGKHIRFTAVDKNYDLQVTAPDKSSSRFPVPDDGTYHKYEIKGSKDQTYTFKMVQSEPPVTVPQMIVTID